MRNTAYNPGSVLAFALGAGVFCCSLPWLLVSVIQHLTCETPSRLYEHSRNDDCHSTSAALCIAGTLPGTDTWALGCEMINPDPAAACWTPVVLPNSPVHA